MKNTESDSVMIEAAFAIAESRTKEGFQVLYERFESAISFEKKKLFAQAIVSMRIAEADAFAREILENELYEGMI